MKGTMEFSKAQTEKCEYVMLVSAVVFATIFILFMYYNVYVDLIDFNIFVIDAEINAYDDGSYLEMHAKNAGYATVDVTKISIIYAGNDKGNETLPINVVNNIVGNNEIVHASGKLLGSDGTPILLEKGSKHLIKLEGFIDGIEIVEYSSIRIH